MRGGVRTRRLEPRGRHGGRRGDGGGERGAARAAEFLSRRDAGAARVTQHVERRAALLAEPHAGAVLGSTRGAPHPGYFTRADGVAPAPSRDGPCGPLVAVWGSERGRGGHELPAGGGGGAAARGGVLRRG